MRLLVPVMLLILAGAIRLPAAETPAAAFHRLNDPETLVRLYESPERQHWQKPLQVVEHLRLKEGAAVADIGAGSGYFSVPMARKVGPTGRVYALDVNAQLLEYLGRRAADEGLAQLLPRLTTSDDPGLTSGSIDLAFICNTYLFIGERVRYLLRLHDALRPDGRLAIVSYEQVESPEGPPLHLRISRDATVREAGQAGFVLEDEPRFLPYQHFLIFRKR